MPIDKLTGYQAFPNKREAISCRERESIEAGGRSGALEYREILTAGQGVRVICNVPPVFARNYEIIALRLSKRLPSSPTCSCAGLEDVGDKYCEYVNVL
jgi:hypothetical protein